MRSNQYIEIQGRLTEDPNVQTSKANKSFFKVGVAVNYMDRNKEGQQERKTFYYNVLCFDKLAEIYKNLKKGQYVNVTGNLTLETYMSNDNQPKVDATIMTERILPIMFVEGEEKPEEQVE